MMSVTRSCNTAFKPLNLNGLSLIFLQNELDIKLYRLYNMHIQSITEATNLSPMTFYATKYICVENNEYQLCNLNLVLNKSGK